jgi:hypothetical protein
VRGDVRIQDGKESVEVSDVERRGVPEQRNFEAL